ncbi:hypothetical protein GCM10011608_21320 [Micromonospora sonchi]|uniref:Uncharacterized protein n=1 Tax=Micromonospora sonchi TaxID=1763543 RepID=A0A917TSN7_9ACTN|nr:hypothetical protein GCM10011608_21320 [Micromonospora sonchi]
MGEQVDGLHDAGVGEWIEAFDPLLYLVDEVDLPLVGRQLSSIADAIPDACSLSGWSGFDAGAAMPLSMKARKLWATCGGGI